MTKSDKARRNKYLSRNVYAQMCLCGEASYHFSFLACIYFCITIIIIGECIQLRAMSVYFFACAAKTHTNTAKYHMRPTPHAPFCDNTVLRA